MAEVNKVFDILNNESDFIGVLIGTSFLDVSLENLLRSKFRKKSSIVDELLNPNKGILGNIGGRAAISYSLELISKSDYQDLITILNIRNMFAHKPRMLDFSDDDVIVYCKKLKAPDQVTTPETVELYKLPRPRFFIAIAMLWARIGLKEAELSQTLTPLAAALAGYELSD